MNDWRKSRRSFANGNCVEVASGGQVRDSEDQGGVVLKFGPAPWRRFVAGIKKITQDPAWPATGFPGPPGKLVSRER